ncbi:MAG: ExbD/TolR family protein [Opitutales bacterium]
MSKRGSLTEQDAEMSDINISPMIDMVFILLIFFIVTTVFVQEPGVEVVREFANTAEQLERNSLLFAITTEGRVFYGGNDVGVAGIRGIVQRQNAEGQMPIIIQADRGAPSQTVIRVIDETKLASPRATVNISTQQQRN